jgi:uncharacterized protein (DUF983 family)
MKTMEIDGKKYVEIKADESLVRGLQGVCPQCAVGGGGLLQLCAIAVLDEAEEAFGGDCAQRDVIYREAA